MRALEDRDPKSQQSRQKLIEAVMKFNMTSGQFAEGYYNAFKVLFWQGLQDNPEITPFVQDQIARHIFGKDATEDQRTRRIHNFFTTMSETYKTSDGKELPAYHTAIWEVAATYATQDPYLKTIESSPSVSGALFECLDEVQVHNVINEHSELTTINRFLGMACTTPQGCEWLCNAGEDKGFAVAYYNLCDAYGQTKGERDATDALHDLVENIEQNGPIDSQAFLGFLGLSAHLQDIIPTPVNRPDRPR